MSIDEHDALRRLRQDIVALRARLDTLEQRLDTLETARGSQAPPAATDSQEQPEKTTDTGAVGAMPIPRLRPPAAMQQAEKGAWSGQPGNGEPPQILTAPRLRPPAAMQQAEKGARLGRPDTEAPPPRMLTAPMLVMVSLLSRVSPLGLSAEGLVATYRSYQAEGKVTALVMTIAGGVALVLGLSYLFQYAFSELLSPWVKVAAGALLGLGTSAIGARIGRRVPDMAEYAASVIAIGLSMLYLTGYFAGPYYSLLSSSAEMLVAVGVTGAAYVLALRFETRLVATLTLLGGAFAPFLLSSDGPDLVWHSFVLTLLAGAGVHLAYRIGWTILTQTTFLVCVGTFNYLAWNVYEWDVSVARPWSLMVMAHGLFYLFSYTLLLRRFTIRESLDRVEAAVLAGNLCGFILAVSSLTGQAESAGFILLANAAPFAVIPALHLSSGTPLRTVFIIKAGILTAVGFFALLDFSSLAIVWALEGVLLVYLGCRLGYRSVRLEGLVLLGVSLGDAVWLSAHWLLTGAVQELNDAWFGLSGTLVSLSLAIWVLQQNSDLLNIIETRLVTLAMELQALWFAGLWFTTFWIVWPQALAVSAIIPMSVLLYRAAQERLLATELLALAHYGALTGEVVFGISLAGSFFFIDQPFVAQIARIEVYLSLWLVARFYRDRFAHGRCYPLAPWLRELFFLLLPVLFLPGMAGYAPEWFPIAMWLSAGIAWLLQRRVELCLIAYEHWLLAAIAGLVSVVTAWQAYHGAESYGIEALFTGLGYFIAVSSVEGGLVRRDAANLCYQPIFVGAVYYLGIVIAALGFMASESLLLGLCLAALYFAAVLCRRPVFLPLRRRMSGLYRVVHWLTFIVCLWGGGSSFSLLLTPTWALLAALGFIQLSRHPHCRLVRLYDSGSARHGFFHLDVLLAYLATTAFLLGGMSGAATSVFLVIHATAVLFLTLRPRWRDQLWISLTLYSFAALKVLGYDMAGFSTVEKILAFLVIGVVLVGGAYQYQKLVRRSVLIPANPSFQA